MLIGELSKKSGVSRDTIRYYEKMGLLKPESVRSSNNYKEYPANAVDVLKLVKIGKTLGFKLHETKEFLSFWEANNTDNVRMAEMIQNKIAEIDAKMAELKIFKQNLEAALIECKPDEL